MFTDILQFLSALKENNFKEWFDQNREWYQKVKKDYETFVAKLITEVQKIDKSLVHLKLRTAPIEYTEM